MERSYYIQLTLMLYRNTEEFPNEELLKLRIRSLANEVLSNLILTDSGSSIGLERGGDKFYSRVLTDIEALDEYLSLARSKNLLDRDNFSFLRQEYNKIKEEMERVLKKGKIEGASEPSKPKVAKKPKDQLKERQKQILEILAQEQSAQVSDLKKFFPQISKRTLRRDLDGLLKKGLVVRIGQWNEVFYRLASES